MNKIYNDIEILTVTYKSEHIIDRCLANIDEKFRITVVENSNNFDFKKKIEQKKNIKLILPNYNLCFFCIKYAEEIHPNNHFFIRIPDSRLWNQMNGIPQPQPQPHFNV